jgi:hypothetical protein
LNSPPSACTSHPPDVVPLHRVAEDEARERLDRAADLEELGRAAGLGGELLDVGCGGELEAGQCGFGRQGELREAFAVRGGADAGFGGGGEVR